MDSALLASPAPRPQRTILEGRDVTLAPLSLEHADSLFERVQGHDYLWDYLFDGPYPDRAAFRDGVARKSATEDPLFLAIVDRASSLPVGHACYMRIEPAHRVIEVGSILYSPAFQKTRGATEAMYLMARHVFEDLGYRRYEWKCNALNAPSRRAALRYGFTFEGIFRQHMIVKGRSRDTAWFAMLDSEWPSRKAAFENWLDPSNFDEHGQQRQSLSVWQNQGS